MSSADYMNTVWPNLVDMGTNMVLELISWRDVEFAEGRFDFSELDTILSGAGYMACASFYGWDRSKTV
ncbi:hypothetical protein BKA56DRAFT_605885 [Ilyonectria sp. MPI-CAGE-AT-0026]|nr:hypothetical protein BKA56DRAFT_605885 [Ilyonectria sp. MPI-CAGE-AT-0026]